MKLQILFIILLFISTQSCGLRNHNECGIRALKFFESKNQIYKNLIQKYPETFQASLTFPDWGYLCRGFHDAAEDIHWPPLINFATKYFYETYGNEVSKWNEETQKLFIFLLGIQSHSITDIVWHSIGGVNDGFIRENAKIAFKGDFQRSHDNADVGGDLVLNQQLDNDFIVNQWYIPSKDLAKIYQLYYNKTDITPNTLEGCSYTQYLILLIEKNLGHLAYPMYGKDSMFLIDEIYSYPIGGVDDMAHRTLYYWRDTIKMIETKNISNSEYKYPKHSHHEDKNDQMELLKKYKEIVIQQYKPKMKKTEKGVLFYIENDSKTSMNQQKTLNDDSYFYKGFSFGKFKDSVVYSSPGYGIEGKPNTGKITFINEKYEIHGTHLSAKFGYQIVFLDFNMDGNIDMAVSGPEYGADSKNYYPKGAVYIFLGNGTMRFDQTPSITIFGDFGQKGQFSNIGRALEVGDVNGDGFNDLIIGSPFESNGRGSVTIYYARKQFTNVYQNVKDANHVLAGTAFSYFGAKIQYFKREFPYLLIGAPKWSEGGIDSRGCLFAYEFKENKFQIKFTIKGSDKFDQTGLNFAIGNPFNKDQDILAISSPTKEALNPKPIQQSGIVSLVEFKNLNGNLELKNIQTVTRFFGDRSFSRLGWEIGFSDLTENGFDEMWISEPMRQSTLGRETGIVYLFRGGVGFPKGDIFNAEKAAFKIFRGGKKKSRFGFAVIQSQVNGKKGLYISSPMRNEDGRNTGFVEFKE